MSSYTIKNDKGAALPILLVMNEAPDRATIEEYLGNKELFMFTLSYFEPPEHFGEIMRYQRELDIAAGRKRFFTGTTLIDMSKWVGSEDSIYFDAFLAYLYDNNDGVNYVFAVNTYECNAIYNKLSEYFAVDMIHLNVCKGELLHNHIKGYFHNKDVYISEISLNDLCGVLEKYAEQNAFNIRRLETICDRLISASKNGSIDEEQIKKLTESEPEDNTSGEMYHPFGISALGERW